MWVWVCCGMALLMVGEFADSKTKSCSMSESSNTTDNGTACSVYDNITVATDLSKLNGTTWYELIRSASGVDGGRCRSMSVLQTSNTTLELTFSVYYQWSDENNMTESTATVTYVNSTKTLYYNSTRLDNDDGSCCLRTLSTDYETYWIIAASAENQSYLSVMGSSREVNTTLLSIAEEILYKAVSVNNATSDNFYYSVHNGCVGYPAEGCPLSNSTVKVDFDIYQYLGSWYVLYHSDPDMLLNCSSQIFVGDIDAMGYFERHADNASFSNGTQKYITNGGPSYEESPGVLCTTISTKGEGKPLCQSYRVLDTDYVSYSVVETCSTLKFEIPVVSIMILSRDFWLPEAKLEEAIEVLEKNSYSFDMVQELSFSACFRDRCPLSWETKHRMSPYQFAGRWIKKASYDLVPDTLTPFREYCSIVSYTPAYNYSIFLQKGVMNSSTGYLERVIKDEFRPQQILAHDGRYARRQSMETGKVIDPQEDYHFILDTTYTNWTVTMQCYKAVRLGDPVSLQVSVLLRRGVTWTDALEGEVETELFKYNLDWSSFESSSENCSVKSCSESFSGIDDFEYEEFLGDWFVIRETPFENATGWCAKHRIQKADNDSSTNFTITFVQYNSSSNAYESESGWFTLPDQDVGNFVANVTGGFVSNYTILYTNYKATALVHGCSSGKERVFVLGRKAMLGVYQETAMLDAIINNDLDASLLNDDVQGTPNCPSESSRGGRFSAFCAFVVILTAAAWGVGSGLISH